MMGQSGSRSTAWRLRHGRQLIGVPQDPNLPGLRSAFQPLIRPFQRATRTLEAKMEKTKLEGTLEVDADDGGAPVQVLCSDRLCTDSAPGAGTGSGRAFP